MKNLFQTIISPITTINQAIPTGEDISRIARKGSKPEPSRIDEFVVETQPFVKSGRGTQVSTVRGKTFYEKLGIKEDSDSRKLKQKFDKITDDFSKGTITEAEATKQIEDAQNKYEQIKIAKNIPKTALIGAGALALSTAVPALTPVIGGVFTTGAILNRGQLATQFKKFPILTTLDLAAGVAGGLGGYKLVKGISGAKGLVVEGGKIADIESIIKITGKNKDEFVRRVTEVGDPQGGIIQDRVKNTGINGYEIVLKDGRRIQIIEYTKLSSDQIGAPKDGLRGEKVYIGFEINKDGSIGTKVYGKSDTAIVDGEQTSIIKAIKIDPAKTTKQKIINKIFGDKAETTTILERTRLIKERLEPMARRVIIESESRILGRERASRQLGNKVKLIERLIALDKKITPSALREIINLERRAMGEKPFTIEEWKASKYPKLTLAEIKAELTEAIKTGKAVRKSNVIARQIKLVQKSKVSGIGIQRPSLLRQAGKARSKKMPRGLGMSLEEFGERINRINRGAKLRTAKFRVKKQKTEGISLLQLEKNIERVNKESTLTPKIRPPSLGIVRAFDKSARTVPRKMGSTAKIRIAKTGLQSRSLLSTPQSNVKTSWFEGQGSYEKTDETGVNLKSIQEPTRDLFKDVNIGKVKIKTFDIERNVNRSDEQLKIGTRVDNLFKNLNDNRNIFRDAQMLRQRELQNQQSRLQTKQRNLQKFRSPGLRAPLKTKATGSFSIPTGAQKIKFKRVSKSKTAKFDVFTRQGKRLNIKPLTRGGALGLGAVRSQTGIKASFYIKPSKRAGLTISPTLERTAKKLQSKFAPSKRTPGLIVERRKFRLDTRTEVAAIQRARRAKSFGGKKFK